MKNGIFVDDMVFINTKRIYVKFLILLVSIFALYQQSYNQIQPETNKNHFKTWSTQPIPVNYQVFVEDQFMSDTLLLSSIEFLSNPTTKFHGQLIFPIIDSTHHLTWYKASGSPPNVRVRYRNQLETDKVQILGTPEFLLVPTRKLPHNPPAFLDYYKAYRFLKPQKLKTTLFSLHDQFDSLLLPQQIDSVVGTYFLTPASFNNSRIYDTLTHYVAYEIFPRRTTFKIVNTYDIFGNHILNIDHSHYVLVPTTKVTTVKVEGYKFHDKNGNGEWDAGEVGLEDWKIIMSGPVHMETYTNHEGKYSFPEAPPGTYTISEEINPGWLQTFPQSGVYVENLSPGAYYTDLNFGNCRDSARIFGFKYNDINGNGVREEFEPPLEGWKLILINENTSDHMITFTNEYGFFEFRHLIPGVYTLKEELKIGWVATAPQGIANPGISIEIANDVYEYYVEILNFKLMTIRGVKFFDRDRSGGRDEGEEGIANWMITLTNLSKQYSRITWTDSMGAYEFLDVEPGYYRICEEVKAEWIPTCDTCYEFEAISDEEFGFDFCNFLPHDCPPWVKPYAKPKKEDMGFAIPTPAKKMTRNLAVRDSGDIYVCGYSNSPWGDQPTGYDYVTIKYDEYGAELWVRYYNNSHVNRDDKAYALITDIEGNVYVTGESDGGVTKMDIVTIKYNSEGIQQWVRRWSNPDFIGRDAGYAIAYDRERKMVFVTGETFNGRAQNIDYVTIAYNAITGEILWTALYNGPGNGIDKAYAISVNQWGNPVVTGESKGTETGPDYATILYDGLTGSQIWVARYDAAQKQDYAFDVEARSKMNYVYVTGASKGANTGFDYATIKYDRYGNQLWVARYHNTKNDYGYDLVLWGSENIAVTGASEGGPQKTGLDFATIKYSPDGTQLWVNRKAFPKHDIARSICKCEGALYVTGSSDQGSGRKLDYLTQKINAEDGSEIWTGRFNGLGEKDDIAYNVRNRSDNCCVVITGTSTGLRQTGLDFATIQGSANSPVPGPITIPLVYDPEREIPSVFKLYQNYPNPFNPITTLKFELPVRSKVTLKIYNVLGQKVATILDNELLDEGTHEVEINAVNFASGVYFYLMKADGLDDESGSGKTFIEVKKMIILK